MKLHSAKVQLDGFASNFVVSAAKQKPAQRVTTFRNGVNRKGKGQGMGENMYDGGADAGKIGRPMVFTISSECVRATC